MKCPICKQACALLDTVDFSKSCEESRGKHLPASGISIEYMLCDHCGFCFAPEMAKWPLEEFKEKIYNDDYAHVDPDYLSIRPLANAQMIQSGLPAARTAVRHLDYGGGNGLMAQTLKAKGWNSSSYDPFVDRDTRIADMGKFDLITAFEVFEHVPDVQGLMKQLQTLLAPSGMILFSTLCTDGNIRKDSKLTWWYASPRNGHISLFSRNSLAVLGRQYGFNFGSHNTNLHFFCVAIPAWAQPSQRDKAPVKVQSPTIGSLEKAIALHQAGKLNEAEQIYQHLQASPPGNADALALLGMIQLQRGNPIGAIPLFKQALTINSRHAMAYSNYGSALVMLKQYPEALEKFDTAITINSNDLNTHCNRAMALFTLKRYNEAMASCDNALAIDPNNASALNTKGASLLRLDRYDEALASCSKAIALIPGYLNAYNNQGIILEKLKRYDEALASYDKAIAINSASAEAHSNRGSVLRKLKRYEEALASCDKAVAINPDYAEAYNNRGITLYSLRKYDEALASCDKAIALDPAYAEAYSNRGILQQSQQRYTAAFADYDKATALNPDYADAWLYKAMLKLLLGDFEEGWKLYEWRWKGEANINERAFKQPLWLGRESLAGKTILLYAEQGLGDAIQFCRYVPMVEALGAKVLLEVHAPLVGVISTLKTTSCQVRKKNSFTEGFDFHCPLMSLPLALKTAPDTIPAQVPYLGVDAQKRKLWQEQRLGKKSSPRIGLIWSGTAGHTNDHNRSIALSLLTPLLDLDYTFYSLQKEIRDGDQEFMAQSRIISCADKLADFSDTAALISEMDLIISVDTSVAHLAGALGKPLWLLLPCVPDFRWLTDREDSPWYRTARLFRQPHIDDWHSVIEIITAELSAEIRERPRFLA